LKKNIQNRAHELREMTTEDLRTVVGTFYGDGWRPAYAARLIKTGKDKGKFELVTRGRGNRARRVIVGADNFKCLHNDINTLNLTCSICGRTDLEIEKIK